MQVNITFRHLDSTEALKAHVREKLSHIQRYVDRPTEAHAVLHLENLDHHADLHRDRSVTAFARAVVPRATGREQQRRAGREVSGINFINHSDQPRSGVQS